MNVRMIKGLALEGLEAKQREERASLEALLRRLDAATPGRARKRQAKAAMPAKTRRPMSKAAREAASRRMKAYWRGRKKAAGE